MGRTRPAWTPTQPNAQLNRPSTDYATALGQTEHAADGGLSNAEQVGVRWPWHLSLPGLEPLLVGDHAARTRVTGEQNPAD